MDLTTLGLAMGWIFAVFMGGTAGVLLWKMARDRIDLSMLLSEKDGTGSLSRFQFLVFTFVIVMGLFLIMVSSNPPAFPKIPTDILGLLGISAGTYAVSKGIQTNKETELAKIDPDLVTGNDTGQATMPTSTTSIGGATGANLPAALVTLLGPTSVPRGQSAVYQAMVNGGAASVQWSLDPPTGSGLLAADPGDPSKASFVAPPNNTTVTIRAVRTDGSAAAAALRVQVA